jgi:hypothetical protein
MDETIRRAYHEAGHAVASIRFGRGFWNVNIRKGGGLEGYEYLPDSRKEIIFLLAGYSSEVKSSPKMEALITAECMENEFEGDFPNAQFKIQSIGSTDIEEYNFEHWKSQARKFIEDDWKSIEAVATELLKRRQLTSCEVKQIMSIADSDLIIRN